MNTPPVKPDNIPTPPEGFTYAGFAPLHNTSDENSDIALLENDEDGIGWETPNYGTGDNAHYAVRTDSEIHKAQPWYHSDEEEDMISVIYNPHRKLKVSDILHRLSDERLEAELERRRKPKTIRIGDHDVPEPLKEITEGLTKIYTPYISSSDNSHYDAFPSSHPRTKALLYRGLVHPTKEAAIKHAEALISFTKQP
jgi:hypothetical protein